MNDILGLAVLTQLGSTLVLVGLTWFVQLVHYPLFARVGEPAFAAYAREHVRRTGWVAAPLMLLEAAGALVLVVFLPDAPPVWIALALLAVVWASTFGLQVPRHRELEGGFDATAHRRLVAGNWIRTVAWTARGVLLLGVLVDLP